MAVVIRMARGGAKKRPYYRIVVTDKRMPRDGRYIEKIGIFNPLLPKDNTERLKIDAARAKYWLGHGALPSERVAKFLQAEGLFKIKIDYSKKPQKTRKKADKKTRTELRAEAAAEAAANPPAVEEAKVEEAQAEQAAPAAEEAATEQSAAEEPKE